MDDGVGEVLAIELRKLRESLDKVSENLTELRTELRDEVREFVRAGR